MLANTELIANIQKNLLAVQERIQHAALTSGRDSSNVKLVVVTKAQPVEVIGAAVAAGAVLLGENYPEETLPKIQVMGANAYISWHMIGHLQSRKIPIVAEHFSMLQSLDSLRLAQKLDRYLQEHGRLLSVLLEFNVSGEASKYGWPAWDEKQWNGLLPEIEQVMAMKGLQVRGLMTMPPLADDPQHTRPYFARLRHLAAYLAERFGRDHFQELSMGTSSDFEFAVQEGATLVRIGTAILGPRPAKSN